MEGKRTVMLKPDDPVWAELTADIEAVVSGRYAEDLDVIFGPEYAPSVEEPGFEFGVLNREDRQNLWFMGPVLIVVWVGSATAAWVLEHGVNPALHNFGDALYWAFITSTTVGYAKRWMLSGPG